MRCRKAIAGTSAALRAYFVDETAVNFTNIHRNNANIVQTTKQQVQHQFPSYIMPAEDVFPKASSHELETLFLGTDINGRNVEFTLTQLLSLMFPYLYPDGVGHYALKYPDGDIPESLGGPPRSNQCFSTLKKYVKYLLNHADRRFAQDANWIFFVFDLIEKLNIQSANRHMVTAVGDVRKEDVFNNAGYVQSGSTVVPYIIRSSFAFQKRQALTLRTIFNHLGKPQLFLTFSCDDFVAHFHNACDGLKPWEDTPRFATAFNRRWHHFFSVVIRHHFASIVGGIRHYSWVMEEQDRGSPHIHMVLWTG